MRHKSSNSGKTFREVIIVNCRRQSPVVVVARCCFNIVVYITHLIIGEKLSYCFPSQVFTRFCLRRNFSTKTSCCSTVHSHSICIFPFLFLFHFLFGWKYVKQYNLVNIYQECSVRNENYVTTTTTATAQRRRTILFRLELQRWHNDGARSVAVVVVVAVINWRQLVVTWQHSFSIEQFALSHPLSAVGFLFLRSRSSSKFSYSMEGDINIFCLPQSSSEFQLSGRADAI